MELAGRNGTRTVTSTDVGEKTAIDVAILANESSSTATSVSLGGSVAFSNVAGDFVATPLVTKKDVTITGAHFSPDACNVVVGGATVINSAGLIESIPLTRITVSLNVITFEDKATNFAAGDVVCLTLGAPPPIPVSATLAAGTDAYVTIITPAFSTYKNLQYFNEGSNPAVLSLDNGATDSLVRLPAQGGASEEMGGLIAGEAIRVKNFNAGFNFTNLTVTLT